MAVPEGAFQDIDGRVCSYWVGDGRLLLDPSVDQATAECLADEQVLWVHSYLVWPHLAVYVLVSGPVGLVRRPGHWASEAIKSIALAVH